MLLAGFGDWVAHRTLGTDCNLHWSHIIAAGCSPEIRTGAARLDDVSESIQEEIIEKIFELLDDFLREQGRPLL